MDVQDRDRVKAEAVKLRKDYHYVRKALRQRPTDRDLRKRAEKIQARYMELQQQLKELPRVDVVDNTRPPPEAPRPMDMSMFEPKVYSPPPPVAVPRGGRWGNPLSSINLSRRTIWTSFLVVVLLITSPFYYLLFFKGLTFYEVPTNSMVPTLEPGDRFAAIVPSEYRRGDVVVVEDPADPAAFLVKRLVALPGDTVRVANNSLWVNEEPIDEPYILEPMQYTFGPMTLREGETFLLGDNRNESEDAHVWQSGFPMDRIVGSVFYIYHPGARRGRLESHEAAFALVPDPAQQ